LRIQPDGDVVDEKAVVDARRVDLTRGAGEHDVERGAPIERQAEVAGEMIEGADRQHAQRGFSVDEGLNNIADRAVAAGCDEQIAPELQLFSDDGAAIGPLAELNNIETSFPRGGLNC